MVNLERICKDFGRITFDNVDPGGTVNLERIHEDFGRITSDSVDQQSTWKGSVKTLEGLPLTMSINGQLGKDL